MLQLFATMINVLVFQAHNLKVVGSNPTPATKDKLTIAMH